MAENEKQLKITSIYDTRGADKVQKTTEDLRKIYDQLGKTIKDVTKGMQELDTLQKRRTDNMSKETEELRRQVDQLKALRQAHLGVAQTFGGYSNGYRTQGASPGSYANQTTYGSQTGNKTPWGFSQGVDTSPYAAQRPQPGAGLMKAGQWMGMIGAGVGMVGGLVGAVGGYMQHSGHAEAHEKTMGLENLARAQSYRNHVFMESRNSPIGYSSYKAAYNFDLKSKSSGKVTTDEFGNIVQPEDAITRRETGASLAGGVQNMNGEMREQRGKIVSGYGNVIGAVGKGISGAGLIAGGLGGAAAGAAIGSVIPGIGTAVGGVVGGAVGAISASGGVGAIIGAIKEGTAAMFNIHHEEKKLREGEIEARQSELSVSADKMKDEILAITRYQMGVMQSLAPMALAGDRASMGHSGYAFGQTDFDKGEAMGITTGAIRGYGRAGKAGLGSIFNAARRGMSSEAATSVVGAFGSGGGDGGKQLERIMQAGVKAGMESIDMGFFEKLAGATAKGHYSSSGGVNSNAAAALMFAGMHRPNQYQVQERIGGVAAGDRLFTENSYFRSRGMVDAARILGTGADGAQIAALSGASMGELMGEGSDRMRAGGINSAQLKAYRESRINNLGDTLGGYGKVKEMVGGQGFNQFLQNLAGRLRNKKTHGAAQKDLDTLSFYSSALTGEQFGDLRGALGAYGVSEKDMAHMTSGKGGMPWQVQGDATVTSTQNRMQNEDRYAGIGALRDKGSAEEKMGRKEFRDYLSKSKGGQRLMADWDKGGASAERAAGRINAEFNIFEGRQASGTAPGYDSTQELNKALGNTARYLENEVAKALNGFVKRLNGAEKILMRRADNPFND